MYTLLVCPFVSNKRQNSRTDRIQNFSDNSHHPRKVYGCSKYFDFVKFKNPRKKYD